MNPLFPKGGGGVEGVPFYVAAYNVRAGGVRLN